MIISTEKLKQRIDRLRKQAADVKWVSAHAAQEMLEVADALGELLAVREAQSVPVQWGAPKTVRQLIQQLQALDQDLETTALLRMPADFRDGNAIRQVPLSISYERLNGQWLAPYKSDGRLVLAFWAKADDRPEGERGELLTAPPAPALTVNFKALAKDLVDNLVDCGAADDEVVKQYRSFAEKACRAAMLKGEKK